jgi:hypothetical protein
MNIEVTYVTDQDEEVIQTLPGKHEVCPKCEGHGTHLNPSIGSHAYSSEEFDEEFEPGSEEREHYFMRGGMYDVRCQRCNGKRVIEVVDEESCTSDEDKLILQEYKAYQERMAREEARYRVFERSERFMYGED